MSEIIHSKATAETFLQKAISKAGIEDITALAKAVNSELLSQKIKFPALEHCAKVLYNTLPNDFHFLFNKELIKNKEIGSWVVIGMVLQQHLNNQLLKCVDEAIGYIIEGNEWYVCDIVGERVIGHGLLKYPDKMLPILPKLAAHEDKWIVRSVGVAAHYATKKGMMPHHAEEVFKLLLSLANTTDFHTKKGIGWGAKTIAKFHPQIIEKYKSQIFDNPEVNRWFVTKVNMGINWRKFKGKER